MSYFCSWTVGSAVATAPRLRDIEPVAVDYRERHAEVHTPAAEQHPSRVTALASPRFTDLAAPCPDYTLTFEAQ